MKTTRTLLKVLFAAYILFLVWAILFKFGFSLSAIRGSRVLNLLPYYNDGTASWSTIWTEIKGNVVIFLPFGFYLFLLAPERPVRNLLCILLATVSLEVMQYVLACGVTDITDVIDNTLGGALGYVLAAAVTAIVRKKDFMIRVLTGFSFMGTLTMYAGILLTNNFRAFIFF